MPNTLTVADPHSETTDLERYGSATDAIDHAEDSTYASGTEDDPSTAPRGNDCPVRLTWREPTGDEMDEMGW